MPVDLRDFGLNPQLCARVQDALRPGEQVRWAGQPILRRRIDWGNYIGLLLFSCPFGGIGGAVLYFAFMGEIEAGGAGLFFAIVMALIFVLFFVLVVLSPFFRLWKLRNTVYVITSRRALIVGHDEDSWRLQGDMVVSNLQRRDGSGNLVFAIRWEEGPNGGGGGRNVEYGFMNIRDVRLVEEILEKAIAERKNS